MGALPAALRLCGRRPLGATGFKVLKKPEPLPVIVELQEEADDAPDEPLVDLGPPPNPDDCTGLPPGVEPLVLWHPDMAKEEGTSTEAGLISPLPPPGVFPCAPPWHWSGWWQLCRVVASPFTHKEGLMLAVRVARVGQVRRTQTRLQRTRTRQLRAPQRPWLSTRS